MLSITLGKAEFDQATVASRRERISLGDEATGGECDRPGRATLLAQARWTGWRRSRAV